MAGNSADDNLRCAGNEIREESRRLVAAAREAVIRSQAARAQVTGSRNARARAQREDPLAHRTRLLAVKAREIAQIEKAIQFYLDEARRWRQQSKPVMADKLEAKAVVERERLALAICERDAWPPILDHP
jgi:glycerol-3-phosphate dehydrogenase